MDRISRRSFLKTAALTGATVGLSSTLPRMVKGLLAQPQGPVPAAVPDANAAGGGPGADERQDAKIARGLASNPEGGVLVQSTPPASVAGALRLQPGDVILTVDGVRVSTPAEFVRLYREQGMPTELTIVRDGRELHLH